MLPEALQYLADEGDHESVVAILSAFKTDTAVRLRLLHQAVEGGDAAQVRVQAHAIGGSARQVGADAVVELCREMELEAERGSSTKLNQLLELVRSRFEEACRATR